MSTTTPAAQENQNQQNLTVKDKNIADMVLERVNAFIDSGQLKLPQGYHAGNAIKAAWLLLQETQTKDSKPVLTACTKDSIAFALQKMIVLGLNPIKKQCNFIAYGNVLRCEMEYSGNIAIARRFGVKNIKGNAIMEGDEFAFEVDSNTGKRKVIKHIQTLESLGGSNVKGAYAIVEYEDGTIDTEIMSFKQIQAAWNQGPMKGNSPAHKNFPDQMAIKTVINRACKLVIRTSDDSILFDEDDEVLDQTREGVKVKIETEANKKTVTMEEEIQDAEEIKTEEQSQLQQEKNVQQPAASSNELTDEEKAEIAREEADLFSETKKGPGF